MRMTRLVKAITARKMLDTPIELHVNIVHSLYFYSTSQDTILAVVLAVFTSALIVVLPAAETIS